MNSLQNFKNYEKIELLGFVWICLWGVFEGLYRIFDGDPTEIVILTPLIFVPLTVTGGVVGFYVVRSWKPLLPSILHHIIHRFPETLQLTLTATLLISIWLVLSLGLISIVHSNVNTFIFRILCIIGGGGSALIATLLFSPLVYKFLDPLQNIAIRRFRPRTLVLAIFSLGLGFIASMTMFSSHLQFLFYLPWVFVVPPVVSLMIAVPLTMLITRRTVTIHVGVLCVFHLLLALAPADVRFIKALENSSKSSIGTPLLSALRRVTDFDGDGASNLYLGNDCAPFDSRRAPILYDVPDDGIDQDCDGWDAESRMIPREGESSAPISGSRTRPHILLITTDALSFRHTSMGGYEFDVTPNLASFASRSVSFSSAFANAPTTYMTLPMLHTGRYFTDLKIESGSAQGQFPFGLSPESDTLARRLNKMGYDTVFIPGYSYFSESRWPGLATGFDRIESAPEGQHVAPIITQRVIANLEGATKPTLVWIHYFDHHAPYNIPKDAVRFPILPGLQGRLESAYNSELEMTDRAWGDLFDYTERRNDIVVIFTSDHGESFDTLHREKPHSHCIRTSETHIPFIINVPGAKARIVDGLVSHLDIFPTVLNLLGQSTEGYPGESLIPVLFEDREPSKEAVFLSYVDPRKTTNAKAFLQYGAVGSGLLFLSDRTENQISLFSLNDPLQQESVKFEDFHTSRGLKTYADQKYFEATVSNRFVEVFQQSIRE